jgi:hypothetical protein
LQWTLAEFLWAEIRISRDRRKLHSYLNEKWQFDVASSEMCQLMAPEIWERDWKAGFQCKVK